MAYRKGYIHIPDVDFLVLSDKESKHYIYVYKINCKPFEIAMDCSRQSLETESSFQRGDNFILEHFLLHSL